jgi:hypothetical protein
MSQDIPRTGPRHEPDRIHERASDPAEAVNRPLEPKAPGRPLYERDEPHPEDLEQDPHQQLSTPVGEPDPQADSDPYQPYDPQDETDRASGTQGTGHENDR